MQTFTKKKNEMEWYFRPFAFNRIELLWWMILEVIYFCLPLLCVPNMGKKVENKK